MEKGQTRSEKDVLGEVQVPARMYYGAQTQRAYENFRIGVERIPSEWIRAHAMVKKAAARVNASLGDLPGHLTEAIEQSADEVIAGKMDEHFPLVIWQSGSGTQFNMNVNEVIANRANELLGELLGTKSPVHPNDHVNMAQSTNDTVPTSMHVATVDGICQQLLGSLTGLIGSLEDKSKAYGETVKIGRTHLQDATPLTLGQEFSGYAGQLGQARRAIESSLEPLYELPIGGTAVGTGLNTRPGYDQKMVEAICEITSCQHYRVGNPFSGLAGHEAIVIASGAMKTLATALMKIANDIRWLASGPRCGIGELKLPANEPGSSIMPGKINPTQCEMATMVCCQVLANDMVIGLAGSQGNFELNVYKPLIGYTILQSIRLLADACCSFNERCVMGLEPNLQVIGEHLENSLMLVTALNRHIGYDKSAAIALKAWREHKTLKQSGVELGYLTEAQYDQWVQPKLMTGPE